MVIIGNWIRRLHNFFTGMHKTIFLTNVNLILSLYTPIRGMHWSDYSGPARMAAISALPEVKKKFSVWGRLGLIKKLKFWPEPGLKLNTKFWPGPGPANFFPD